MAVKTTIPLLLLIPLGLASLGHAAADGLVVQLSANQIGHGEDLTVTVTVSTTSDQKHSFRIGGFAECFGVYILGPWGPVQPDPQKMLPQNWMHGEHSASREVVIEKVKPFTTTFKLSDFFRTKNQNAQIPGVVDGLLPGRHQLNVKFFVRGWGLPEPIDSGPVEFTVVGPPLDSVVADKIAALRRFTMPPQGTSKSDVDAVFGKPTVTKELEGKGNPAMYPLHSYRLLPPKEGQESRAFLYVTYREDKVYHVGINHLCVVKGRPFGKPDPDELAKENRLVLADLNEIMVKYRNKLEDASWNK